MQIESILLVDFHHLVFCSPYDEEQDRAGDSHSHAVAQHFLASRQGSRRSFGTDLGGDAVVPGFAEAAIGEVEVVECPEEAVSPLLLHCV
jgi:hypothetical protein